MNPISTMALSCNDMSTLRHVFNKLSNTFHCFNITLQKWIFSKNTLKVGWLQINLPKASSSIFLVTYIQFLPNLNLLFTIELRLLIWKQPRTQIYIKPKAITKTWVHLNHPTYIYWHCDPPGYWTMPRGW